MARKGLIGLDIGSSSVKLTLLKPSKKGYQLLNFGMVPLPPETIVDGALMNSPAVVDVIRELVAREKIKQKDVAIAISGHSVIIKKISLPVMSAEELEEQIQWEAEQYIPFEISEVNLDVQILNEQSSIQGQMDVLLVAAKKDLINDYAAVVAEAGLQPMVVDVDAFAVENQFEINYELTPGETIVLVNCGASKININILADGVTTFTRDINMGGNLFTEEIQKQLHVSYDEAEALKIGGSYGSDSDAVVPQEVERVIQSVSQGIAGEIQRSLDFYVATSADSHISKIYFSGGSSKIPALYQTIEQRLSVPVELMNPFRHIQIDTKRFDANYLNEIAPQAAVSVGLALRYPQDK